MGTLDKFLEETDTPFDVGTIMSRDVEEMDSPIPPPSLYKYYSASRSAFFVDPVIRFTQKTALNDPFELTKRWEEYAGAESRMHFAKYIRSRMEQLIGNKGLVLALFKEDCAKSGVFLSPDQMAEAAHKLLTRNGSELYNGIASEALDRVDRFIEDIFRCMNLTTNEALNKELTSKIGIFSLFESPVSEQMWGLYASSGAGFVIEFNAQHEFFKAPNGRSLLRKVKYTSERAKDFFANPLALFQVKGDKWSFEQEWRMIKELSQCDEKRLNGQELIYVNRLKPGMMRSVIFGYNYNNQKLAEHGAKLRMFDPELHVKCASVNSSRCEIEVHELL